MSRNIGYNSATRTRYELVDEEWVNSETGEIVTTPGVRSVRYGQNSFIRIDRKFFYQMAKGLGKTAHSVLDYFIANVSLSSNVCHKSGARIAAEMNLHQSAVEKALSELRISNIIRSGGHCMWMLNPKIGIGCEEARREALLEVYESLSELKTNIGGAIEDVNRPDTRTDRDE